MLSSQRVTLIFSLLNFLRQDNVLIHNKTAYLTDFGLSSMISYKGLSTKIHGNLNFVAPEQYHAVDSGYITEEDKTLISEYMAEEDPARPTVYSDMYAFGCTFFQVR